MSEELKPEGFLNISGELDAARIGIYQAVADALFVDPSSSENAIEPNSEYEQFISAWTTEVRTIAERVHTMAQQAATVGNQLACVDFSASAALDQ